MSSLDATTYNYTFHFLLYISPNTHTLVIISFLFTRRRLQLGSRKLVLNKILVRERLFIFNHKITTKIKLMTCATSYMY